MDEIPSRNPRRISMATTDVRPVVNITHEVLTTLNRLMDMIRELEQRCADLEEKYEMAMRNIHGIINFITTHNLRYANE